MSRHLEFLFFITLFVIIDVLALTGITSYKKLEKDEHRYKYLIVSCILYGIFVPLTLIKLLEYENIGTLNFIWNIFSTIIMISIGYYYFNEKINKLKIIAFILGFISLILLYISDNNNKLRLNYFLYLRSNSSFPPN
jgi:drug/metabolite transporter (DMT)-like permease